MTAAVATRSSRSSPPGAGLDHFTDVFTEAADATARRVDFHYADERQRAAILANKNIPVRLWDKC
jgi:hypothetical protein